MSDPTDWLTLQQVRMLCKQHRRLLQTVESIVLVSKIKDGDLAEQFRLAERRVKKCRADFAKTGGFL